MNVLESQFYLPMWTIVSHSVVYNSVINMTPNALNRVCRLLHRWGSTIFYFCQVKIYIKTEKCFKFYLKATGLSEKDDYVQVAT